MSYTPYLTSIANDISLGQITYYNRINDRSAFAGSLRYFGLGDIELRQSYDDPGRTVNPNELALDGSYSLKLSETFSMGVAGRYIRSNLKIPDANTDAKAIQLSLLIYQVSFNQKKLRLIILMVGIALDLTFKT